MGHTCTVCDHPRLAEINDALSLGDTSVATECGFGDKAIRGHRSRCMFRAVMRAKVRERRKAIPGEADMAQSLTMELLDLKDVLVDELEMARTQGKGVPLNVVRELKDVIGLCMKAVADDEDFIPIDGEKVTLAGSLKNYMTAKRINRLVSKTFSAAMLGDRSAQETIYSRLEGPVVPKELELPQGLEVKMVVGVVLKALESIPEARALVGEALTREAKLIGKIDAD